MLHEIVIKQMKFLQNTNMQAISIDSLLISDFVKINRHVKDVLDIGTGNGIIPIILSKKTKAKIKAVELLKESCDIARLNVENNQALNVEIINQNIYEYLNDKQQIFDVIVSNPPYFNEKNEKQIKNNINKSIARNEKTLKIKDLIDIAARLLKNKGHLYIIIRAERLNEIIKYFSNTNLVPKELCFVYTKENDNAFFCLIDACKDAKDGIKILKPINVYKKDIKKKIYEEL